MGTSVLAELVSGACAETAGHVRAFHAELEAAAWRSWEDFIAAYPACARDGDRAIVAFDEQTSVILAFNFACQCVLLEERRRTPVRRAKAAMRS